MIKRAAIVGEQCAELKRKRPPEFGGLKRLSEFGGYSAATFCGGSSAPESWISFTWWSEKPRT
jgi:hypothetical protein